MEYIVSFPKEQANHPSVPFGVEMAGITYPDREYHIYRKRSELFCMEYVISGQGTVSVDHQTFSVGSGDIYILPHNVSHDYRACADDPYEKIWFNIQGTIILQVMTSYHLEGIYHISHAECLRQRFYEFLDICRRTLFFERF